MWVGVLTGEVDVCLLLEWVCGVFAVEVGLWCVCC